MDTFSIHYVGGSLFHYERQQLYCYIFGGTFNGEHFLFKQKVVIKT